jgi:hypothetical protein
MEVRFAVMSSLYKVFLNMHTYLFVHTACMCTMCFQLLYTLLLPQSLWWQVCKRSTVYNSVGQQQLFCNSTSQLLACIWKRSSVRRAVWHCFNQFKESEVWKITHHLDNCARQKIMLNALFKTAMSLWSEEVILLIRGCRWVYLKWQSKMSCTRH